MTNTVFSDPSFPNGIPIDQIQPYITEYPRDYFLIAPESQAVLKKKLEEKYKTLTQKIAEIEDYISEILMHQIDLNIDPLNIKHSYNRQEMGILRKIVILSEKYAEYDAKVMADKLKIAEQDRVLANYLLVLCDFIMNSNYAMDIKTQKFMKHSEKHTILCNKHYQRMLLCKFALEEQKSFLELLPTYFSQEKENRDFIRSTIDFALTNRKSGTNYFEVTPMEEELYFFLENPTSPIYHLLPVSSDLKDWLSKAIEILVTFDSILNEERRNVISIYLYRFAFEKLSLIPPFSSQFSDKLAKNRELIRHMTPRSAKVSLKYIPSEMADEPVIKLFTASSIAAAPLEWLQLVQFKSCPLDIAYCIFKVHESLSILATLEASKNATEQADDSHNEFFERMPGFDDIFGLWMCLLAVSDIADPQGISEFVSEYSNLPGFCKKFGPSCTYLEASAIQVEGFEILCI